MRPAKFERIDGRVAVRLISTESRVQEGGAGRWKDESERGGSVSRVLDTEKTLRPLFPGPKIGQKFMY